MKQNLVLKIQYKRKIVFINVHSGKHKPKNASTDKLKIKIHCTIWFYQLGLYAAFNLPKIQPNLPP